MASRRNVTAVRKTVRALREAGRLSDADEALIKATESLAAAVDEDPTKASLWTEYRAALRTLMEAGIDSDAASEDDIGDAMRAPVLHLAESRAAVDRSRDM